MKLFYGVIVLLVVTTIAQGQPKQIEQHHEQYSIKVTHLGFQLNIEIIKRDDQNGQFKKFTAQLRNEELSTKVGPFIYSIDLLYEIFKHPRDYKVSDKGNSLTVFTYIEAGGKKFTQTSFINLTEEQMEIEEYLIYFRRDIIRQVREECKNQNNSSSIDVDLQEEIKKENQLLRNEIQKLKQQISNLRNEQQTQKVKQESFASEIQKIKKELNSIKSSTNIANNNKQSSTQSKTESNEVVKINSKRVIFDLNDSNKEFFKISGQTVEYQGRGWKTIRMKERIPTNQIFYIHFTIKKTFANEFVFGIIRQNFGLISFYIVGVVYNEVDAGEKRVLDSSFKSGDKITMKVDIKSGYVRWFVGDHLKAEAYSPTLKNLKEPIFPYIQMFNKGDLIEVSY